MNYINRIKKPQDTIIKNEQPVITNDKPKKIKKSNRIVIKNEQPPAQVYLIITSKGGKKNVKTSIDGIN
jgi:hypothetical protein